MALVRVVGVLHPGAMGAAVGVQLVEAGHRVLWAPAGRSGATARRAEAAGLSGVALGMLLREAEVMLSICPPAAAVEVARAAEGYHGLWVEANAVAPHRVARIAGMLSDAVTVDGSIIGSPPLGGKGCSLYLAGPAEHVRTVEGLFAGTRVEVRGLGDEIGLASGLKLAYSTFQKTSRTLAALAYELASEYGVDGELLRIARRRPGSYLAEIGYIPETAARAWRWSPELAEAADTLDAAGLPGGLAREAAEVLASWPRPFDEDQYDDVSETLAYLRGESPAR